MVESLSTARTPDGTQCPDSRAVKGKHSVGWYYGTDCEWCGQLKPRDPAIDPRDPAIFARNRLRQE